MLWIYINDTAPNGQGHELGFNFKFFGREGLISDHNIHPSKESADAYLASSTRDVFLINFEKLLIAFDSISMNSDQEKSYKRCKAGLAYFCENMQTMEFGKMCEMMDQLGPHLRYLLNAFPNKVGRYFEFESMINELITYATERHPNRERAVSGH